MHKFTLKILCTWKACNSHVTTFSKLKHVAKNKGLRWIKVFVWATRGYLWIKGKYSWRKRNKEGDLQLNCLTKPKWHGYFTILNQKLASLYLDQWFPCFLYGMRSDIPLSQQSKKKIGCQTSEKPQLHKQIQCTL